MNVVIYMLYSVANPPINVRARHLNLLNLESDLHSQLKNILTLMNVPSPDHAELDLN